MKRDFGNLVELGRVRSGLWATEPGDCFGIFDLRGPRGEMLRVMVSDGADWSESGMPVPAWEHVSVSLERRCPTWEEMSWIKSLFWFDTEAVVQIHPPASEHINFHPHCLHLWRPIGVELPRPPAIAVGPRTDKPVIPQGALGCH